MKAVYGMKKSKSSNIPDEELKKLAANKLGRTGKVLAKKNINQLDPLFEEFKNEL
jgi:hypothetical protein